MLTITLTSDFGLADHTVALVKGQLMQHLNEAPQLIDVTHSVANYDLQQAAFYLQNMVDNFVPGTFHCNFVDLFGTKRKHLLCIEFNGQFVFTADNGFVKMFSSDESLKVYAVPLQTAMPVSLANYVQTIANCINWLSSGQDIDSLGEPIEDYIEKTLRQPSVDNNTIEGHILYIDKFENVITNIPQKLFHQLKKDREFKIVFLRNEVINKISETYADVSSGEKLALFNASGMLEIAINQGNAAGLFGLLHNEKIKKEQNQAFHRQIYYLSVRVEFE